MSNSRVVALVTGRGNRDLGLAGKGSKAVLVERLRTCREEVTEREQV